MGNFLGKVVSLDIYNELYLLFESYLVLQVEKMVRLNFLMNFNCYLNIVIDESK